MALVRAGDFPGAAAAWRRASALEPSCLDHRVALAASLERAGLPLAAARELEEVGDHFGIMHSADWEVLGVMRTAAAKLKRGSPPRAGQPAGTAAAVTCLSGRAGHSEKEVLFRFIHVSDLHIGQWIDGGADDIRNLAWLADVAYPAVRPAFIAATGDLTDSTNGFILPLFGPYQREWDSYASLVSGLPRDAWRDMPGNHDHYGDKHFSFYLRDSASRRLQYSWTVDAGGGLYQFIAVNTSANDGRPWPWDRRGLDDGELDWLEAEIRPDALRVVVFGHHPPYSLKYGRERFERILSASRASYFFGHSHKSSVKVSGGRLEVNVDSLGKDSKNNYALAAVLEGGDICVSLRDAGSLP